MNRLRWGLLMGAVGALAGIGLMGASGAFIVATGLAGLAGLGVGFNLLVPSALIRFFALTRVGAAYASRLWLHDALLARINRDRVALFRAWAQRPRLALGQRGWQLDMVVNQIDRRGLEVLTGQSPRATGYAVWAGLVIASLVAGTWLTLSLLCVGAGAAVVLSRAGGAAHRQLDDARAEQVSALTHVLLSSRESLAYRVPPDLPSTAATAEADRRKTRAITAAGLALDAGLIAAAISLTHLNDPVWIAGALMVLIAAREPLDLWVASYAQTPTPALAPADDPTPAYGPLATRNLQVGFDGALNQAPLTLAPAPGERVWLQGPSGSGKTAALDTLAGLLPPVAGQTSRPERLAYTPQFPFIFDDTTAANLSLYAAIDPDKASAMLVQLGLAHHGLDRRFQMGGRISADSVSGGEARRLGLIRSALQPSDAWLLDEPLVGLDEQAVDAVIGLLEAYRGTLIIVSHDERVSRLSGLTPVALDGVTARSAGRPT